MPDAVVAAAGTTPESGGYDPGYYEALWAAEDEHFWFSGRARAIEAVVAPLVAALPTPYRVLEIGCGTGHVLAMLERVCADGHVVGMDLFRAILDALRSRRPVRRARAPV